MNNKTRTIQTVKTISECFGKSMFPHQQIEEDFSIMKIVVELRSQRPSAVQTKVFYYQTEFNIRSKLFIYIYVL
jgi:protein tyrosine phosphatase